VGVTVHFFAFDPAAYAVPPTIDGLVARGDVDRALCVAPAAAARLTEIDSRLGDNKRWYDNIDGDDAWSSARAHVDERARVALDHWLSHLFWDGGEDGCPCGRAPVGVAGGEVVYDRALVEHIVSLACALAPVEAALALGGDPSETEAPDRSWIYGFDGFCYMVHEWQRVFEETLRAGPERGLLRWVWI
jgi:hypothetical protein